MDSGVNPWLIQEPHSCSWLREERRTTLVFQHCAGAGPGRAGRGAKATRSYVELGLGSTLRNQLAQHHPFPPVLPPSAGTWSTWSVKRLSVKSTGSFRRVRSARKISDLPSAWIKKIKGVKGVSPVVGEGWSTCNRTVGSGVGRERARRQVLH